jgi:hypothetical protein
MAHTASHGSDKGAAFIGLIGGLLFIGAVVYAVSVWTSKRFEAHGEGEEHAAVTMVARPVA